MKDLLVEIRKDSRIIILIIIFINFCLLVKAEAELILAEGDVNLLSCTKIYDRFFLLYSNRRENFSEVLLKEFDSNWREIQKRRLDINGASAYPAYFNDRFYVSYTSFEKEGNVRIAEFDSQWNLLRDILVTPTPYDGEVAYQLIPMDDNHLYLFYARNWVNDCGLKMVEFNRYLEIVQEITLMKDDVNFHIYATEFSSVFANGRLYMAYKRTRPQEGMDIFVNEYTQNGELIMERCVDRQEKLSPSLFFEDEKFYLAYEGYDDNLMKPIVYVTQYDIDWNLLKRTRIITQETGAPREKAVIASEGRCYLVTISEGKEINRIFLKEIDFNLEEDRVKL